MAARDGPVSSREVAEWAIETGKWKQHPAAILRQCADELSDAMREEYIKDAQGPRDSLQACCAFLVGVAQPLKNPFLH